MINADDVFRVFEEHRGKAIVTTSGVAGRKWPQTSNNPERDVSMGNAMGQTTSSAFGLALGLPDEKIVLFDSGVTLRVWIKRIFQVKIIERGQ